MLGPRSCTALDNFWRSLSNLTINVTAPPNVSPVPCPDGTEFWATSQASPMRRVDINGTLTLFDYCTSPSYSSGGFIADSVLHGGSVINGSQQQFLVRNSNIDDWTNSVWNQVFSGDIGAPAQSFGVTPGTQYTTLPTSPVTEEEPFLYTDSRGSYHVFVPAVQHNSSGPAWASGTEAGTVHPDLDVLRGQPEHACLRPSTLRWPGATTSSSRPASTTLTSPSSSAARIPL